MNLVDARPATRWSQLHYLAQPDRRNGTTWRCSNCLITFPAAIVGFNQHAVDDHGLYSRSYDWWACGCTHGNDSCNNIGTSPDIGDDTMYLCPDCAANACEDNT